MIILAAATFFAAGERVSELEQAQKMLNPLVGSVAAVVFAVALIAAGLSSSVTAGMAGGAIYAGIFREPSDISDRQSQVGVGITLLVALLLIFFIRDPFQGLIISQMMLSVQLPITVLLLIHLTSSTKVMGSHANTNREKLILWAIAAVLIYLNIRLLFSFMGLPA
jgi:manganese transport protein